MTHNDQLGKRSEAQRSGYRLALWTGIGLEGALSLGAHELVQVDRVGRVDDRRYEEAAIQKLYNTIPVSFMLVTMFSESITNVDIDTTKAEAGASVEADGGFTHHFSLAAGPILVEDLSPCFQPWAAHPKQYFVEQNCRRYTAASCNEIQPCVEGSLRHRAESSTP